MDDIVDLFQEYREELREYKQSYDLYNSPKMREKILATDYLIEKLLEWWHEKTGLTLEQENFFGKQKMMKLIFFAASVPHEDGSDLLDIFDNWYAMPYGPVESDVWDFFRLDLLPRYRITNKIEIKNGSNSK